MNTQLTLVNPSGAQLLTVTKTVLPSNIAVVEVRGEVDASNTATLHDALHAALRLPPAALIVDLAGVDFFSSSGISALMNLRRQCAAADLPLRLVAPRAVHRVLDLVGLGDAFTLLPPLHPVCRGLRDHLASMSRPHKLVSLNLQDLGDPCSTRGK